MRRSKRDQVTVAPVDSVLRVTDMPIPRTHMLKVLTQTPPNMTALPIKPVLEGFPKLGCSSSAQQTCLLDSAPLLFCLTPAAGCTYIGLFMFLSSTSALIRNRASSDHASACSYQDALTHNRVSQGKKCRLLHLVMVTRIGIMAEQQQLGVALKASGYQGIKEAESLALMEYLCDRSLKIALPLDRLW